jgi:hypothetical protein
MDGGLFGVRGIVALVAAFVVVGGTLALDARSPGTPTWGEIRGDRFRFGLLADTESTDLTESLTLRRSPAIGLVGFDLQPNDAGCECASSIVEYGETVIVSPPTGNVMLQSLVVANGMQVEIRHRKARPNLTIRFLPNSSTQSVALTLLIPCHSAGSFCTVRARGAATEIHVDLPPLHEPDLIVENLHVIAPAIPTNPWTWVKTELESQDGQILVTQSKHTALRFVPSIMTITTAKVTEDGLMLEFAGAFRELRMGVAEAGSDGITWGDNLAPSYLQRIGRENSLLNLLFKLVTLVVPWSYVVVAEWRTHMQRRRLSRIVLSGEGQ